MAITEDIVKTLKDPTPLYAVAGGADLAAEKLREVPALIEKIRAEAPERVKAVRETDPKAVQERVVAQAKDAQAKAQTKFNEYVGTVELDLRKVRDTAQDIALQGVGRAAEYAVKAREAYDGLAERGKGAVQTWRGEAADQVEEVAAAIEGPETTSEPAPATAEAPADTSDTSDPVGAKKALPKKTPTTAKKAVAKPGE